MSWHEEGEKFYNKGEVLERTRYISSTPVDEVIAMLNEMKVGLVDPRVEVATDPAPHGGFSDQWIMVSGKVIKPNTQEENIAFRKKWDEGFEAGERRKRERS